MSSRMNPDLPGSEVELVHTDLEGDSFFDLGDLDVFGLDRNAGSNPCADANGGCDGLCLQTPAAEDSQRGRRTAQPTP